MSPSNFYSGLFLVTASTLMLQLIQTRILSVIAWYHLAFFAISMAMFGLTAGAVWVYFGRDRFTEATLSHDLAKFSMAFALTTALCLAIQMTLAPVVLQSVTSIWTWLELAICLSVPFFFSGVVVSLALTRSPFPIGRVYGADLVGAAVGCLGVLLLLNATDGPSAVLWVAALCAAAAIFFGKSGIGDEPQSRSGLESGLRRRKTILLILIAGAYLNGTTDYGLQPLAAKGKFEGGGSHLYREWNSFSRIAVFPTSDGRPFMWGPSPKLAEQELSIEQRWLNIDGDAATIGFRYQGDPEELGFLRYDVTNLAYHLPDLRRGAVIGIGAGRDMLSAAVFGVEDITGVEINPIFVNLLTREPGFAEFTNFDAVPGTRIVTDEGRSWFARTDDTFDIVQMSAIDTWAATGAGAFTLSENGLYTVEAWRTFLRRLEPGGVFTVSRWYSPKDPTETGRMLSLAVASLMDIVVTDPKRNIFLAAQGNIGTLVMARSALSEAQLEALHDAADAYEHEILVTPRADPDSATLARIVNSNELGELWAYTSTLAYDLTPSTDDRPFFFNQLPLDTPISTIRLAIESGIGWGAYRGGVRKGNLVATATLLVLFVISLVLVTLTIVIPLRPAIRDVGGGFVTGGTMYFFLIGVGFMMVEIGLLQRMSVFLGHPIYSLSVLLFTLILTTGLGSLLSDRYPLNSRRSFLAWSIGTGVYILLLPLWLPHVFDAAEGGSPATRATLCVVTIAPAGLLMGYGFPTGMRLISAINRKPTPWFWGINGAAGVLASTTAVACSIAFGIGVTVAVGAVCYLLLIPAVLLFLWPRDGDVASA